MSKEGFIDKILGKAAAAPIEAVGSALDKLFTSKDEKLTHKEIMERIKQRPGEAQVELNKVEAEHRSMFVAGWRPLLGYICGVGVAMNFVLRPLINYVLLVFYPKVPIMESLDTGPLMVLITGMLGFGGLRTYEKLKGKTK